MSRAPLAGKRILVTRPSGQAAGLSESIRKAGGEPLEFPTIEIQGLADPEIFFAVADRLESYDIAIFVSRNAVGKAMELLYARRGGKPWPAHLKVATVGSGSREELEQRGISGVIAPAARPDSEALLALAEFADVAGKRIVIFRGEGGRRQLGETLAARGARVEHAVCYRRARPDADNAALRLALRQGAFDGVAVSSSEGLANLFEMAGTAGRERLRVTPHFVPHARVADAAARFGVRETLVAGPGDREMVAALAAYFGRGR